MVSSTAPSSHRIIEKSTPVLRESFFSSTRHVPSFHIELELIQTQMAQKPMLRAEVGMRGVRCANKASAE